MKRIRTETVIEAPPDAVWAVLADFARYAEWNPLNPRAEGRAAPGARVRMAFIDASKPGRVREMMVTLTACEPGRRLGWVAHLPLLFRGEHSFDLTPEGGATRLVHGEVLSGLIPAFFTPARIARDFVPFYEAANEALRHRVAALGAG